MTTYSTASADETFELARGLASRIPCGSVLALHGDLGAGKTLFTRGFARGLGITEPVTSPTFTILQEYSIPGTSHRLCHFDLYRIADTYAALDFGMDEYLSDSDNYCLIEWSERAADLLPPNTIHVFLDRTDVRSPDDDEPRLIRIENDETI